MKMKSVLVIFLTSFGCCFGGLGDDGIESAGLPKYSIGSALRYLSKAVLTDALAFGE